MKKTTWPGNWKVVCSACSVEKVIENFYIHSNGKPRKQCKTCVISRQNPDKVNRKKLLREYRERNLEKVRQFCRNWRVNNLKYDAYRAGIYRASRIKRTPPWANLEKIKSIYLSCPKGYHVDHIIPLRGSKVSGLHVENNLQYLLAKDNLSKRNSYEEN